MGNPYPVGSIYISVNNISPASLFGGEWVQLTETFLYASTTSDSNSTTATGGEKTHTLSISEMPSHTHTQNSHQHKLPNSAVVYYSSDSGSLPNGNAKKYTTNTTPQLKVDSATATNQNTGGGQAHNNMPPYMRVYMWKRTA